MTFAPWAPTALKAVWRLSSVSPELTSTPPATMTSQTASTAPQAGTVPAPAAKCQTTSALQGTTAPGVRILPPPLATTVRKGTTAPGAASILLGTL